MGGGGPSRVEYRDRVKYVDNSVTCARKRHKHHKDVKVCPNCTIEDMNAERVRQENLYTNCRKGHKHLKSEGCHVCQAASDRKAAEDRAREERRLFEKQLAESNARAERERQAAEKRLENALAKVDKANVELRQKMQRDHEEKQRQAEFERLVINYKSLVREFDSFVKPCKELQKALQGKLKVLREESKHFVRWSGMDVKDKSIIRMVLFSPTGHGKSTLANRILGDDSEDADQIKRTSHLAVPCTGDISHDVVEWKSKSCRAKVCVIDTPGWDESPTADRMHANKLINYLRGAKFVHGICIVKNQSTRFQLSDCLMLEKLEALVGPDLWQHVLFVMTHVEGRGGRPAKKEKFMEWKESLLRKLDEDYDLSDKLRQTAKPQPPGVTSGNRKSIRDIPVVGLSSFDESGGEFDYNVGISKMVRELQRMGQWTFGSLVSEFDRLAADYNDDCEQLAGQENKMLATLDKMRALEGSIGKHPEAKLGCFEPFQSAYSFTAGQFVAMFQDLLKQPPKPAPSEQKSPDRGDPAADDDDDDEKGQWESF